MSVKIALLGPPGSGKGSLGKGLEDVLGLKRLCAGDLLRGVAAETSELGLRVASTLKEGHLVAPEITLNLIEKALRCCESERLGWLLDGFPRSCEQWRWLAASPFVPDFIFYLRASRPVLIQRLLGRRIHAASGRIYHLLFHPPLREGVDDLTGEPLSIRTDDNERVVAHRLEVDAQEREPLMRMLEAFSAQTSRKRKVIMLDAEQSRDQIQAEALRILGGMPPSSL